MIRRRKILLVASAHGAITAALAATYHKWYNVERVVPMALTDPETRGDDEARKALEIAKNPEPARAAARLKLNDAVQQVIANGLDLLGVTAPEKM